MAVAALVTWLVTALGGFIMLGTWMSRGGHRPGGATRLAPAMVFGPSALAAAGLVVWIAYLATTSEALAWVGFAALLPVALLGFVMFARWIPARRTAAPESGFPVPLVLGHGLLAATTLVLVLLTALGIGS